MTTEFISGVEFKTRWAQTPAGHTHNGHNALVCVHFSVWTLASDAKAHLQPAD